MKNKKNLFFWIVRNMIGDEKINSVVIFSLIINVLSKDYKKDHYLRFLIKYLFIKRKDRNNNKFLLIFGSIYFLESIYFLIILLFLINPSKMLGFFNEKIFRFCHFFK